MFEKKDPGKFTVRFNIAYPQQRTVIELLNQQGRYKAQFLTSAVLHYVHCTETPANVGMSVIDREEIERIVHSVLSQQQTTFPQELQQGTSPTDAPDHIGNGQSDHSDRDTIFKTLEAFRQQ